MAKAIKIPRQPKVKEPVRVRYKTLSDGSQSVYLDMNAIKSQRIIELTNGVAGLKNTSLRSKMLLLDWMQAYKDSQEKKGVRGSGKLIGNTMNVLPLYR